MLDIGWTELLVIGIVALIVVGPKDLPIMFRKLGQFTGKLRGMAREFQRAMDNAADEAGMREVTRDLRNMTSGKALGLDSVNDAVRDLKEADPRRAAKWPRDPQDKATEKSAAPKPAQGEATAKLAAEQAAARAARADAAARRASGGAVPSTAPAVDEPPAPAPDAAAPEGEKDKA
ncbi:Sec-independent protein translocase protein TatB [Halodurantibacterium flavum]|uniref:Sec-independent protein translocase protein TatB n=1 Tax=Halodurantibacterium flavum TaxID=1382802 RepID=A0ABW4S3V6_9RHOB